MTAWISISDGMLGKETFPWLDRALRSSVDVDWYDLSTGTGGLEGMDGVWESDRAADAGSEVVFCPPRLRMYLIAVPNEFAENNEDSEARVLIKLGEDPIGSKFGDELFNGTRLGLDVYPIRATFEDEFEEDEWPRVIEHPIRREPSDGGDLLGGVRLDRDNSRSRSLTNLIVVATGLESAVTLLRSEYFSRSLTLPLSPLSEACGVTERATVVLLDFGSCPQIALEVFPIKVERSEALPVGCWLELEDSRSGETLGLELQVLEGVIVEGVPLLVIRPLADEEPGGSST